MKMLNRHLFLSILHTNICSLYTKKFLKKFCKNTWLFPAPCGIIKGWGVGGGTGVPYFFWSKLSLLLYHILKQKSIKIVKNFLKNFSKKTWLSGAKCDIIKGGEVFFFFLLVAAHAAPSSSSDTPGCVAGRAGPAPYPHLIWSRPEPNKCLSIDFTWFFVIIMLGVEKMPLYIKYFLIHLGALSFIIIYISK